MIKCVHGVYIPEGFGTKSRHCSLCTPITNDQTLCFSSKATKRNYGEPELLDVAEFLHLPVGIKLMKWNKEEM
jgi:hypothetical protein